MTTRKAKHPRAWGVLRSWGEIMGMTHLDPFATGHGDKNIRVRIVPESDYRRLRKIEREYEKLKNKMTYDNGFPR